MSPYAVLDPWRVILGWSDPELETSGRERGSTIKVGAKTERHCALAYPVDSPHPVALCAPRQKWKHQSKWALCVLYWESAWLEVGACCMQ